MVVGFASSALLVGAPDAGAADPREPDQWNMRFIQAPEVWSLGHTGDGFVIAVVDTGVDKDHPELAGRLDPGQSWLDCPGSTPCSDPSAWDDRNGHGTHVAGIAAAPRDGVGVTGVAPGARIMPVRVLDENGEGSGEDIAAGIDWAVANGAHVINLSLGFTSGYANVAPRLGLDGGIADAITRALAAKRVVVAAAGNDAFPVCAHEWLGPTRPICVGSTGFFDQPAWYSNWGVGIDVVAPGGDVTPVCDFDILSTYPTDQPSACEGVGYERAGGTSMAAPHVSGIAALLLADGWPAEAIRSRIIATADDFPVPHATPLIGPPRVNALAAVTAP